MKKYYILFLISFLAYAFYQIRLSKTFLEEVESGPALKSLPSFKLVDIAGTNFDSTKLENGRPTVVHFWATWCSPCLTELPKLAKLPKVFEKVNFVFIAVRDKQKRLKKYQENLNESGFWLHDSKGVVMEKFGTFKLPETYIFSSDNKLISKAVGPKTWSKEFMNSLLKSKI